MVIKKNCSNIVVTMSKAKTEVIRVRISSKHKKELQEKAKALNISLSAYVLIKLS